jgi:hypothetical protein
MNAKMTKQKIKKVPGKVRLLYGIAGQHPATFKPIEK